MNRPRIDWLGLVLAIPAIPLILLALFVFLPFYLVWCICFRVAIWCWWCARGRDVLFVYSDSPIWHDYVEDRILSELEDRAVVLNWSERKRWRTSLATLAFRHFGGSREF